MTGPAESVFTCHQLTGLGAFYTYFLSFVWSFELTLNLNIYIAFLGAIIVLFSSENRLRNSKIEPKTLLVCGLFGMSVCSAALAASIFAEKEENEPLVVQFLPKIAILLFFTFFCVTRAASVVYVTALTPHYTENYTASIISWIAACTLFGLKIAGFPDYSKNLASCIIAFGFLFLSLALFLNDRLPPTRGLMDYELAEKLGFLKQGNVIRHEEARSFTGSDGTMTHFFRNLTTDKVAYMISFSNESDTLENAFDQRISYIRCRGHARVSIKQSQNRMENDRFLVLYSTDAKSETFIPSGFLTISL